ncbi:hypothetical protein PIB30_047800 [Stylosanthes scabra]|uniref:Transmembrane protein n=1 Tax=Stylosanthes scabra TaxID=79078 RepID=A0ABU6WJL0_9FABA|nr:hypothetical protein [Stylosanthes scabra]
MLLLNTRSTTFANFPSCKQWRYCLEAGLLWTTRGNQGQKCDGVSIILEGGDRGLIDDVVKGSEQEKKLWWRGHQKKEAREVRRRRSKVCKREEKGTSTLPVVEHVLIMIWLIVTSSL